MEKSAVQFPLPLNVHPKGGGLYFVTSRYIGKKRKRVWTYLSPIAAGEATMLRALADLRDIKTGDMLAYLKEFRRVHIAAIVPASRKEAERMLGNIEHAFQDFDVADVDAADVMTMVEGFGDARNSARAHKALLSKFFKWAVFKRLREYNPCREVTIKLGERKMVIWTPDIYHAIRDGMGATEEGQMMQCYMDLTYLAMNRGTDVRLLYRKNISDEFITVQPRKTRRSTGTVLEIPRTGPINEVLERAAAIRKGWGVVSPLVICTRAGTPYTRSGIYSAFLRSAKRSGIEGADPKSLRSFAADQANKAGYHLEEIQDGLGHADISTTQVYVRKVARVRSKIVMTIPAKKP